MSDTQDEPTGHSLAIDVFHRHRRNVVLLTMREATAVQAVLDGLHIMPDTDLERARNVVGRQIGWLRSMALRRARRGGSRRVQMSFDD